MESLPMFINSCQDLTFTISIPISTWLAVLMWRLGMIEEVKQSTTKNIWNLSGINCGCVTLIKQLPADGCVHVLKEAVNRPVRAGIRFLLFSVGNTPLLSHEAMMTYSRLVYDKGTQVYQLSDDAFKIQRLPGSKFWVSELQKFTILIKSSISQF